jgi:hypothetical protein
LPCHEDPRAADRDKTTLAFKSIVVPENRFPFLFAARSPF